MSWRRPAGCLLRSPTTGMAVVAAVLGSGPAMVFASGACSEAGASDRLSVVASTTDLAYWAGEIGGEHVEAEAIASPTADLHFVEVRPSYMAKLSRADVVIKVGLGLDGWMDRLIGGSRNPDLRIIDASAHVRPMEVPGAKLDARHGDIHPEGNPHYWIGPQNVPAILKALLEGLSLADPERADAYRQRHAATLAAFERVVHEAAELAEPLRGRELVLYHNSWPYFAEHFGLRALAFVEPFPGVPPSPTHVKDLHDLLREREIRVIGMEPYFDRRVPERLAGDTPARIVILYPSIGGREPSETYRDWLLGNLRVLVEAFR